MPSKTPKQRRQAAANKLEAAATPANPKVKPSGLALSAAETRAILRALRS